LIAFINAGDIVQSRALELIVYFESMVCSSIATDQYDATFFTKFLHLRVDFDIPIVLLLSVNT